MIIAYLRSVFDSRQKECISRQTPDDIDIDYTAIIKHNQFVS